MTGLLDRIRSALSGASASADRGAAAPAQSVPPPPVVDDAVLQARARRNLFWAAVGIVETDLLETVGDAGTTYRVVRREEGTTIIATDGLSDTGEGKYELFVETADLAPDVAGSVGVIDPLRRSWAFGLLRSVVAAIDDAGPFDRDGALAMAIAGGRAFPPRFLSGADEIGVLVGAPPPDFPERMVGPSSPAVRLLPLIPLTATELASIRQGGDAARHALVNRLSATPTAHRASLTRASVV